jgi:hypothetical protein
MRVEESFFKGFIKRFVFDIVVGGREG